MKKNEINERKNKLIKESKRKKRMKGQTYNRNRTSKNEQVN